MATGCLATAAPTHCEPTPSSSLDHWLVASPSDHLECGVWRSKGGREGYAVTALRTGREGYAVAVLSYHISHFNTGEFPIMRRSKDGREGYAVAALHTG